MARGSSWASSVVHARLADQSAELGTCSGLQGALRGHGGAGRHVARALRLEDSCAWRRAEIACDSRHLNRLFVRLASFLGVTLVRGVSGRSGSWRGGRSWGVWVLAESRHDHVVEETASVGVGSFLQSDETVVSPCGTPRVAHDPGASVVSDCDYSVIQVGSAVRENATTLHLPGLGVDSNGHRSLDYSGLESAIGSGQHLVASNVGEDGFLACLAGAVLGGVRLAGLSNGTVCLELGVAVLHDSALAAVVHLVAVHQLLLGQHRQLLAGQLFPGLERLDGAEGPAAAALSLVLDWGQSACVSPVFFGWAGAASGSPRVEAHSRLEAAELDRLEFLGGEIRQAGDSQGVGCSRLVVRNHQLEIALEDGLPLAVLIR